MKKKNLVSVLWSICSIINQCLSNLFLLYLKNYLSINNLYVFFFLCLFSNCWLRTFIILQESLWSFERTRKYKLLTFIQKKNYQCSSFLYLKTKTYRRCCWISTITWILFYISYRRCQHFSFYHFLLLIK